MRRAFREWVYHPAAWWECWYPMSGIVGGTMLSSIFVGLPVVLIYNWR